MKKGLLTLSVILILSLCPIMAVSSWDSESSGNSEVTKEVGLNLSGTKRCVVGFSNVKVKNDDTNQIGAFDEIPRENLLPSVELKVNLENGRAERNDGDFFIFYQIVSSDDISISLYAGGPMHGNDTGNDVNFTVSRASGNGEVFIDTSKGTGDEKTVNVYNHSPSGADGRYAWADSFQLKIETAEGFDFRSERADRYSATIYALVKVS